MVGFFWCGKHRTDDGFVNQGICERRKKCMDRKAYIHQRQTLKNSLCLVEEVPVVHGHCIGFLFAQAVQQL